MSMPKRTARRFRRKRPACNAVRTYHAEIPVGRIAAVLERAERDMSLVGPRPERKYFIDEIVKTAPYYYLLHNVRPGITSLGMVKYGYAASVDKMVERMEYDILYYENMSLTLDLTILIYTVKTVITGKGV